MLKHKIRALAVTGITTLAATLLTLSATGASASAPGAGNPGDAQAVANNIVSTLPAHAQTAPIVAPRSVASPSAVAPGPYIACDYFSSQPGNSCWKVAAGNVYDMTLESTPFRLTTAYCGNCVVTSTWPFADHGLDRALIGHQVVAVQFTNGQCMSAQSNNQMAAASCQSISNDGFVLTNGNHGFDSIAGANWLYYKSRVSSLANAAEVCTVSYEHPVIWNTPENCNDQGTSYWWLLKG